MFHSKKKRNVSFLLHMTFGLTLQRERTQYTFCEASIRTICYQRLKNRDYENQLIKPMR